MVYTMQPQFRVALLGFTAFERGALASYFRLATHRKPTYEQVDTLAQCDFAIADADHATTVQRVLTAGRVAWTVFIGHRGPPGALAWMPRPIDPLHVLRELDAMAALSTQAAAAAPKRAALLVDDSEVALRFLQVKLQRFGLQTECATSGARAVQMLSQRSFDFIFLDVELGRAKEPDGLALCQRIKRQPAGGGVAPLVAMVSAHQSEVDRARGALAGCDAYLGKPLQEAELVRLLVRSGLSRAAH
jgi:CheY-like chemotaxis protein